MEAKSGRKAATKTIGKSRLIAGVSFVALAMGGWSSPAAAQTWTGNTSSDWTTGSNWSTGAAPTTGTVTINTETPNPTVIGVSGPVTATSGLLMMGTVAGTSSLTIQNGSTLTSTAAGTNQIGQATGTNATITVTGLGSAWSTAAGTILGQGLNSTGTLNILDRASAGLASLTVGQSGGGSGVVNVSGGGVLTVTGNVLMFRRSGSSTATISGIGSQWNVGGTLTVGSGLNSATSGSGVVNIDNGATVSATGVITIGGLALSTAGLGVVTVTGAGSQLSGGGALNIGQWGIGTLTVSDSAVTTATTVTLAGGSAGNGTLNLSSGGILTAQGLTGGAGLARQVNFDGGTLRATASNTAFISGFSGTELNIAAGGLTLDTGSFNITAASPFTGVGALTKIGAGSAVLTGDSSYTGGTTISAGMLQLGSGGTTGSISGNVVNNGALAFNRSDSLTFTGAITGTGAVSQIGSGTTILTGSNGYTGGTTISAGALQLGSGGTGGSIAGNVVNNAALVFNRSDAVTFAGLISGSGTLTQAGSGTTILTGTNSYSGATNVNAGTLRVNGDQSGATGLTSVASGATLGGSGIIGGDVTIADGGILSPGNSPGTLTINGNLTLDNASQLNFEFGQASVPGGSLNDLVNVGGNLTLDGVVNVTQSAGGSFGPGVYRMFNYAGTLTDNGLSVGSVPAGAQAFVQTAVANQVNLVNTAGLTLNFWDGAAGPKNDGLIQGSNGTWRVGGGQNNWTDVSGAVNADYAQDSFAIFQGTGGTVTIDNGGGNVSAAGMQFTVDGYAITGGALALNGTQALVRVGDGTAADAGLTTTIDAVLTGSAQLVKDLGGTLVLSGTNSYSGGTAIDGGTLQIASDANLGAAAGGLSLNGGTLHTTADIGSNRAVDLAGAGTFLTDASTTLTLSGAVSGAGSLTKSGAGTLALSGAGSYAGATNVAAGTLLVNGNYTATTGATTVAAGASLGGTGTIGGDVTLAGGATLTPGSGGAGTLTINGNLSLAAGTTLAYEFGAANVAGGTLNDLVNVGGNLTLDGTIDVTVPAGGAFDAGVYRVFNYGGALTDNGLSLGSLPAGSNVSVQTSIAGQVNLVNTAGLTLSFWDGAAGPKNNGVVNGGTGIWQASGGNDNWTDASGTVNAAYSDGAFAVFGGTGGTVTIDNGLGQVTAAGMQFAANGYTITGGDLTLTGPQSVVRVGDGSTAGAGYTATINAALSGASELVKTDAGTLVLGGTNSYTGGTRINGGTLQVASDANLGAASGAVTFDGGTLATSANVASARDIVMAGAGMVSVASGTTFTFNGRLSGNGPLTNGGAGTLLMTGDNSAFAGSTRVEGTMIINGSLCGDINVAVGGRLGGTGTVCTTVNAGTIAPGNSIGTLTVAGTYTGNNGVLEIETELGGDASPTDRLVVTNGTAGSTEVVVTNRGGLGAQTVEGIKIIDVTGGTSAGMFTLKGDYSFEGSPAVIAGAYGYRLFQGGVSTPADGDWYLRSALLDAPNEPQAPLYQPGVPLYESYTATLQRLNRLGTLQERVGNRQWSGFTQGGVGMWGRMESARYRPEAVFSTSGSDLDVNDWSLQAGFDKALLDTSAGTLIAGINGRYGKADSSVRSRFGNGSIDTNGYGLGATLTWYDATGFYADAQAQLSWYRSDLKSTVLGTLVNDNHGSGEAFSLEAGKRAPLGGGFSVTPQIQMTYSNVRFDAFTDPNDAAVAADKGNSLKSRWGISLDHQKSWDGTSGTRSSHVYGIVNLSYEWLDGSVVDVSGTPIARRDDRLWGEVGVGGSYSWADGRFTIFSEVSANTAINNFGDSNTLRGNAGFRMRF